MPVAQHPLILMLVGALAGIASGLFGVGGGLVMVPIFMQILKMDTHIATATSLSVLVLPVALPAVIQLYKAGNVKVGVTLWVALGFALAGTFGAKINLALNDVGLRRVFAILLIYSAIQMWMKPGKSATQPPLPPTTEQAR